MLDILLTGSVAFDFLMTFPGYFKDHILPDQLDSISLSFLVDSMVKMRGGVAPNIAYNLALLGEHPRLWAAVGEDFEDYRTWLESKGVDTSGARVIAGEYTASFFVNTDHSHAQIASFYPGAMAYAAQLSLKDVSGSPPDLVMISPNDPAAMNLYVDECLEMGLDYIYDPSQQICRLSHDDLRRSIPAAHALIVNEYEYGLIYKMTGWQVEDILEQHPEKFIVITRGKKGATIYTTSQEYFIPIAPTQNVIDPTGVGDAFRGGFLTGYGYDFDFQTCGQMGSLSATYCLEHHGPQNHNYTPWEYINRYRTLFDDQGKLDVILGE